MSEISQYIRKLAIGWGKHPYDINRGDCLEFAEDIQEKFQGSDALWDDAEPELFPNVQEIIGHVFIRYKDKYYDAEEPNGVSHPNLLPCYGEGRRK